MTTRNDFMNFFRDEEKMVLLSVDDRLEIFETILLASSDITVGRLNNLCNDYCVENISIKPC